MSSGQPISEQQFSSAFEYAAIGMALLGPDSRVLRANRALCDMLGCSEAQLLGTELRSPAWPQDFVQEQRYVHKDGRIFWGHLTCTGVPGDEGQPMHFIAQVQDITAQKAVHQRLREQAALLDQARDAIVIHGIDRTIRFWNKGAERMFGYTREQALGQTFASLMGPGAALPESTHVELLAKGEWVGELECVAADARMLIVERRCTVMLDADGQPSAVLAINTDVSERRRAEKEIVLLNNILEQRIRKRTAELEESNEDLRDFAYSLAHDLRAPLASIDGFSAQLEQRLEALLDDKSRHYLKRVRSGVKLMSDLTDALLALADLSNTQLLHQSVDLSAVARGIVERLREQEPQRDVVVHIEDTPPAQGDIRLLSDVMENLLGNAWKFTSKTGKAEITFGGESWPNGSYLYHVKDNGAGFDPTYGYKLFGPFQRLHTAAEFEGTGIGLAMVRKIVSRHGGRVWAESISGEGASFFFTLNEGNSMRAQPATAQTPAEDEIRL